MFCSIYFKKAVMQFCIYVRVAELCCHLWCIKNNKINMFFVFGSCIFEHNIKTTEVYMLAHFQSPHPSSPRVRTWLATAFSRCSVCRGLEISPQRRFALHSCINPLQGIRRLLQHYSTSAEIISSGEAMDLQCRRLFIFKTCLLFAFNHISHIPE